MRSSLRLLVGFAAVVGLGAACGGQTPEAARPGLQASAKGDKKPAADAGGSEVFGLPNALPKLRLMPDLDGNKSALMRSGEGELSLIGRMRLRTSPTGETERADELLPAGRVVAQRVPARLGGGFVFLTISGRGSELWRSSAWLGALEPLAAFGQAAHNERPLTMGFDRFYLRLQSGNEIVALDPRTGSVMPYGPMPIAPAFGDMVFLDGWRAVVDTDVAGTLATFDAGATWSRLATSGRVRSIAPSSSDPDDGEEAVIQVDGGSYQVSASGHLTFAAGSSPVQFATPPGDPRAIDGRSSGPPGPLGRKPLRVALERGYPDSPTSALVAHEGSLVRVSLETGAVLATEQHAYPDEHAECVGIALGSANTKPEDAIGFVCGSPTGPTAVYAFQRPLGMREVLRFQEPRVVTESGQGAIVVRGACGKDEPGPSRPFCVRFADGSSREVRIRGEVGVERVIALADGRVVILVPPRSGAQGQLSILQGKSAKHIVLKMPEAGVPRELETGMWLEGFHQSAGDEIAGWVEAGGPMLGVRIKLDGSLTVGEVVDEPGGTLVAGRLGLAIGDRGRLLESTDTGKTWKELDLPTFDDSEQVRSRRCGAAGCALAGWLKVGWGESAHVDDLKEAAAPPTLKLSTIKLTGAPLSLDCQLGRPEPKRHASTKKNEGTSLTGWAAFRSVDAPSMQKGDVGIDNGAPFDAIPMRSYVWGKKDADWSRSGRFLIRYGDKYALDETRSSAVTTSPYASEAIASDILGVGAQGYTVSWSAQRDLSSALLGACRGRMCALFAVEPEQPILTLRTSEAGGLSRPLAGSAVKLGQVWFFLGDAGNPEQIALYRADLGHVRLVSSFRRLMAPRFMQAATPRLIRRAKSEQLGLLFVLREGPSDKRGVRYVLPIDPDSGDVGDPVRLGRPDFADMEVSAGCGQADGWLAELPIEPAPDLELGAAATSLDGVELRMRMDEGKACIEGGVGTIGLGTRRDAGKKAEKAAGAGPRTGFSLMATDRAAGDRREIVCSVKPRAPRPSGALQ